MQHQTIVNSTQLRRFCRQLRDAPLVGFDTEFVSEDTYRPDLCLIQVALGQELAVIDPREVSDIGPFWQALCEGEHTTIVHAGREEFRFCFNAVGQRPRRLFDTQMAAGFLGLEYPASYSKLIAKLLNQPLSKGETRTDWRRRPLSERQIEYALQDVIYLEPLHAQITVRLQKLGRTEWLEEEMQSWQDQLEATERRENWRRVSGASGLPEKSMVIVRELWRWREAEAQRQNRPPRRVLRDDLIVELARRGKSDPAQIRAIRGIERSLAKRHFEDVAECIRQAQALPRNQWPGRPPRTVSTHASLVSQFISTALGSICRSQQLAPGLVGTVQDVRELVDYRLQHPQDGEAVPALARGWRARVVGQTIDDLLAGKLAIRIDNPRADDPLALEPLTDGRHG